MAALGLAIGVLTATPAAFADPGATPNSAAATVVAIRKAPMTFQREVSATRDGANMVIRLDNGATFSVPAAAYEAAQSRLRTGVQPQNTVYGNCGYSYTYLYNWYGTHAYRLAVGFHVNTAAIWYSWSAYVSGAGSHYYQYHYTASGNLAWDTNWAGGHTGTVPAADWYDADTDYGVAELWYVGG